MPYLPDEQYRLVTSSVPIVCVDIIPVRQTGDSSWEIGVIERATGSQASKLAVLGGRIHHSETISEAIARHLQDDLSVYSFSFLGTNSTSRPFIVQQYAHAASAEKPTGFDPTKHAIALTYLIELTDKPHPQREASSFTWINSSQVPYDAAFNQDVVMRAAFDFLAEQALVIT